MFPVDQDRASQFVEKGGGFSIDEKPGALELAAQIIELSDIADHCVAQGRATREELKEIANELREFGRAPDTLFALSFGEAVGWKPVSVN